MAEIVLGPVVEGIAPFMKRQFKYVCCFNANVQRLTEEANELEAEGAALQVKIDEAANDGRVIGWEVETWMKEVDEILQKKRELVTDFNRIGGLSVRSRYSASKGAFKAAAAMKQMREDGAAFTDISHLPTLAARVPDTLERPMTKLESREKFEQYLITLLKDENVKIVGICGMGGVGKTTLAQQIRNRVLEENVFGECVMVPVSQNAEKAKIQGVIAEQLGLKLEQTSLSSRAQRLRTRLTSEVRILIILDDVWEPLNLEELGISGSEGCTILLTSRDRRVLEGMNNDGYEPIVLEMKILNENEAWSLFKENLGTLADHFSNIAQDIANECKCLPLALTIVANALKNEKNIAVWRSVLQQLKSSNPRDLPGVLPSVYTSLKRSYDYLSSERANFVLLLCALFPEDFDIPIRDLTAYAMGLGKFEDNGDLEQARVRTESLVTKLKSHFLLLEGLDEGHVRMHDFIRNVAIFIASREKVLNECGYDSIWISPFVGGERIELSRDSVFPKLRLLLIDKSAIEELQVSNISFEGMRGLNVLSISHDYSFTSLPHTTQVLKNLRTLILRKCRSLKTLCGIGECTDLEILYCQECGSIEELPLEIGRLIKLKLLHISDCACLNTIPARVISKLIRLEELTLVRSFKKWEVEVGVRKNAALTELYSLSRLTTLKIEIEDASLGAGQIHYWQNLREFSVIVGNRTSLFHTSRRYGREMQLVLEREVIPGDWFLGLVLIAESLVLQGQGSRKFVSLPELRFFSLKRLVLENAKMTRLTNRTNAVFPVLESLCLKDIEDLEEIHNGSISSNSFNNLQELRLESLPKLHHLWDEEEGKDIEQSSRITFPKLRKLHLHDLPRLTSFCRGIEFPLLSRMEIMKCPNLKTFVASTDTCYDSLLLFCKAEDVVCDVAISIAEKKGSIQSLPRQQTNDSNDHLAADTFTSFYPSLRFLLINNRPEQFPRSNDFPESPEKFDVMYIGHCIFITLPSHNIHLLRNVRKLVLESCKTLKDISVVGELASLEILRCQRCDSIKELPVEIGRLYQLKLLHFSDCVRLKTVAAGVISRLVRLQELTLIGSFRKWEVVVKEGENAALRELNSLRSLTTLKIEIEDASLAAEQIRLPNLAEFDIRIGKPNTLFHTSTTSYKREMQLVLETDPGDWIHQLVKSTENLVLQGKGSSKLVPLLPECHTLRRLIIQNATMSRLSDGGTTTTAVFRLLKSLCLKDIENIEGIHNGPMSSDSFENLQEIVLVSLPKLQHLWNVVTPSCNISCIHIAKCDSLRSLFLLDMAGGYLSRLERIIIRSESMLEQVVLRNEEGNGEIHRRTGKLQFLDLHDLPKFTSLYGGLDSIGFTFNSQNPRRITAD